MNLAWSRAVIFALLVVATFAAFVITQRLKRTPPVVQGVTRTKFFSPNGDDTRDIARFSFKLKRADEVTVAIVGEDGGAIRTITDNRPLGSYERVRLSWDGLDNDGRAAPDGPYRIKLGLRREGRSVVVPATMRLDNTPPEPTVTSIGPDDGPGPEIVPATSGHSATIRFAGPTKTTPRFFIYRTDLPKPQLVDRFDGRSGSNVGHWDGRIAGKRAPAGTYLVALRVRDRAGNYGTGPRRLPPFRAEIHGRPGITVRYVAVHPPSAPVRGGQIATFTVDTRGRRYSWSVRRLGNPRVLRRGSSRKDELKLHAPRGNSGVYLLTARTGSHTTSVPFAVRNPRRRPVLLVLPATTWQGLNPVDDSGRGFPTTLLTDAAVRQRRPLSGDGLPTGFTNQIAPLVKFLDREHLRYDITTDLALAKGSGPRLAQYRGVILAGQSRWLAGPLGGQLYSYVERGGHLLGLGTQSLRRTVRVTRNRILNPSAERKTDLLGERIGPLLHTAVELLVLPNDTIALFTGTDGLFSGFDSYEQTAALPPRAQQVAAAGPAANRVVIVAYRLGQGLVIRTGLPQWSERLSSNAKVGEVMSRTWTLLSH